MAKSYTGRKRVRKSFGRIPSVAPMPNLIEVQKSFVNKRPQTLCRLTPEGRKRFFEYVTELENVVADAARTVKSAAVRSPEDRGFSPA